MMLSLGIGANTAIFSVINAVLLKPLPYPDSGALVRVFEKRPRENRERNPVSPADFFDWREQATSFERMAAFEATTYNYSAKPYPVQIPAVLVSPGFFELVRARPLLGRTFLPEEEVRGRHLVVMLTHSFWQERLGGDPAVVGRTLTLNSTPHTIVGVMPPEFVPPLPKTELLAPEAFRASDRTRRADHDHWVIARLKPLVTLAQARAEMDTMSARLERDYAVNRGHAANIIPLAEVVRGDARPMLLLLFGAVGFVLLIACANAGNLLLERAMARGHEISVRLALGASGWRLGRQLLVESLLLSTIAGVVGGLLALWGVDALQAIAPRALEERAQGVTVDGWVLVFTALIALLSGLLFGLMPAWRAARATCNELLTAGGRAAEGGWNLHRNLMVIGEIALSVILLVGAGLLLRSFYLLNQVQPGFDAHRVVSFQVSLPFATYSDNRRKLALYDRMREEIGRLPGVQNVSVTSHLPFSGQDSRGGFEVEGFTPRRGEPVRAHWRVVGPGYFDSMRIPLRSGRFLDDRDTTDGPPVMIVNETAARRYWPNESPIGKRARMVGSGKWCEVVGVAGDSRHWGLENATNPEAYFSYRQAPHWMLNVIVRTGADPLTLVNDIRSIMAGLDPDQPVALVRTMDELIDASVSTRRFTTLLLSLFAGIALVLAALGTCAQMAYRTAQRTREIGLRVALGARQGDVVWMVLRQGMILALAGIAIGLAGAGALSRFLATSLYQIQPTDPASFAAAALVVGGAACLASYLPARRAARIDPMAALRYN
jgi:predicted permease